MVVSAIFGFWHAFRRRAAVVRTLQPFVDRWRYEHGGEPRWDEPAVVGFLVTLITRVAQRDGLEAGADALGALQSDAWTALTGQAPDLIGERVVAWSVGEDPRFLRGCRNALLFAEALTTAQQRGPDLLGPTIDPHLVGGQDPETRPVPGGDGDLYALWDRLIGDTA